MTELQAKKRHLLLEKQHEIHKAVASIVKQEIELHSQKERLMKQLRFFSSPRNTFVQIKEKIKS